MRTYIDRPLPHIDKKTKFLSMKARHVIIV